MSDRACRVCSEESRKRNDQIRKEAEECILCAEEEEKERCSFECYVFSGDEERDLRAEGNKELLIKYGYDCECEK